MKPIGGYFELELRKGEEFHQEAIRLNSGRNAFEYILRAREYKKVYLPYFTCAVMLEPIIKLNIESQFYHINEQLEPIFDFNKIGINETFLYINYFGIKSREVKKLSKSGINLIIDNSQAFFEKPIKGIDTFYSPRKFFGVPDGAYLYTNKLLQIELSHDISLMRFSHLTKRIDEGAKSGYFDFKMNDDSIKGQSIKLMSTLTQALLCNIDYDNVIKIRKQNFRLLEEHLQSSNILHLPVDLDFVPMVFPYFTTKGKILKKNLIQKGIFVATYWPNLFEWCDKTQMEYKIAEGIVPIPIDQRYGEKEMEIIISHI